MIMAQTAIKTVALMGELDMKRFLSLINKVLYSNIVRIREDRSMTLSLIDYRDRTFTVTGQHESLIVCRRDGKIELTDTADLGLFLGFEPDISRFVDETKVSARTRRHAGAVHRRGHRRGEREKPALRGAPAVPGRGPAPRAAGRHRSGEGDAPCCGPTSARARSTTTFRSW